VKNLSTALSSDMSSDMMSSLAVPVAIRAVTLTVWVLEPSLLEGVESKTMKIHCKIKRQPQCWKPQKCAMQRVGTENKPIKY